MQFSQNVYSNDRNMLKLPFLNLFKNFPISKFLPKISDRGHLINNSKYIDIKAKTLHLSLSTYILELLTIQLYLYLGLIWPKMW